MSPFNLKWGILATGNISHKMAKDLLSDPSSRSVSDITHSIVAVASSSGISKAHTFISDILASHPNADSKITPYGTYTEMMQDKEVQIVYIGSPHAQHYEACLMALKAGKHVLCEKAFTLNAKQAEHLCSLAKSSKLFLMEAQWTRFFPLVRDLQSQLHSTTAPLLGPLHRMTADFSFSAPKNPSHRMYDLSQGGGALLDAGVYALLWAFIVFYRHPANEGKAPAVTASVVKARLTPVDEQDVVVLKFEGMDAQVVSSTSMVDPSPNPPLTLHGEKGSITLGPNLPRPTHYTVHLHNQPETTHKLDIPGQGMHWQADECARCISKGELESTLMPHVETIEIMRIMDAVRKVGGVNYGKLEDVEV